MAIQNETHNPNTDLYKYSLGIKFIIEKDIYEFESYNVRSLVIDSDYDKNNMPLVFITAVLDKKIVDKMIENTDIGKIILELKRCNTTSDHPDIYEDYIVNDFAYFMDAEINKNDEIDFKGENEGREDIFRSVTIGLMCIDHLNKNNKPVNGIFTGKLSSIMYYLTGHMPILIEPPKENIILDNIFIPPIYSVSKSLEYINSLHALYTTPYRFFMDFDCAYLTSTSGKAIPKKGEDITDVMITLKDISDSASIVQGMKTENNMYKIDIGGIDCEMSGVSDIDKSYTKLESVSTYGEKEKQDLSSNIIGKVIDKKSKIIRVANENSGALQNIKSHIDSSAIQLLVQKTDLDSAVFTPNKEYTIKADEVYKSESYNGRYLLVRKRELYIREDEDFISGLMLLFKKIQ